MAFVQEKKNDQLQQEVNGGGGEATILAIGTANPPNIYDQSEFPEFYFRVTKNEDKTELKQTFKRMCEKSMIRKRHLFLTEEKLKENPSLFEYMAPSLDVRQNLLDQEVAKLGKEAAEKALKEWGHPKSKITHLVFATMSGVTVPGADYQLTKLLGLNNTVKRHMIYLQGCSAGGTALRLAKDLAENNKGGRVLVVCSEIIAIFFRGPSDTAIDSMLGQALFADGAAAVIVGAEPDYEEERPLFQLVSATQTILPGSEDAMSLQLKEAGLTGRLSRKVPALISENIQQVLDDTFGPLGINDWNSIFWITHPGGRAILDKIEARLGLKEEKMKASRHVLSEYGNMASPCVLFILDAMRKMSLEEGKNTTGDGLDWGVLFGFGPGLTVEAILLRSFPI